MKPTERLYLSPPHMGGREKELLLEAFDSNWIAPLGPHVDAFEHEFAKVVDVPNAVALSSGTAGLHLALQLSGVGAGDDVLVSTFTFIASVNPICYLGASPVFVDSELSSWNIDPDLIAEELEKRARAGRLPKAVVAVHLYGQTANLTPIMEVCARFGVTLIEDAAEALGATYRGKPAGGFGKAGIFSFNGNKIITTSGGGMLVSDDAALIAHARKLATQAREPAPHYEHTEAGYNYRMSNLLAAVGRGQLEVLSDRVGCRQQIFASYTEKLSGIEGISMMPDPGWGESTHWLTVIRIDKAKFGCDRETVRLRLEELDIEARPVWKPMHLQPVFASQTCINNGVSDAIFADGLCLPSGSSMTTTDVDRVASIVAECAVSR